MKRSQLEDSLKVLDTLGGCKSILSALSGVEYKCAHCGEMAKSSSIRAAVMGGKLCGKCKHTSAIKKKYCTDYLYKAQQ